MNRIVNKTEPASRIKILEFQNQNIANKAKPGQFILIQIGETGERFPITISNTNPAKGTVKIVFNEVGTSSMKLGALNEGEDIQNIAGPLGNPTEIAKFGTVLCVAGGVMIGPMTWEVAALKQAGNKVLTVIGARNKDLLIFKDEMKMLDSSLYISTDDGSEGYTGLGFIRGIIEKEKIDRVLVMSVATVTLETICDITRPYNIKTVVSLSPIMLDGTGMCGACRVLVGGETKFACVDGPEFDGHLVDWDLLESRKRAYSHEERISALLGEHVCRHTVESFSGGKSA
jgi:ferredoxin/flavodoxin---NADP+ reductase